MKIIERVFIRVLSKKIIFLKQKVLTLMGGEILLCRGSAQKIERTAGAYD
jgi:hypothetical protein